MIYSLRAIQEVERGGEVQNGPTRPSGAILTPGKGYSTSRGGSDDGAMVGTEGKRIKTPGAVE